MPTYVYELNGHVFKVHADTSNVPTITTMSGKTQAHYLGILNEPTRPALVFNGPAADANPTRLDLPKYEPPVQTLNDVPCCQQYVGGKSEHAQDCVNYTPVNVCCETYKIHDFHSRGCVNYPHINPIKTPVDEEMLCCLQFKRNGSHALGCVNNPHGMLDI